ncbi:hypothetical protein KIPB_011136, partial [Kipferlia bialata]|eukprot:g11136.t1
MGAEGGGHTDYRRGGGREGQRDREREDQPLEAAVAIFQLVDASEAEREGGRERGRGRRRGKGSSVATLSLSYKGTLYLSQPVSDAEGAGGERVTERDGRSHPKRPAALPTCVTGNPRRGFICVGWTCGQVSLVGYPFHGAEGSRAVPDYPRTRDDHTRQYEYQIPEQSSDHPVTGLHMVPGGVYSHRHRVVVVCGEGDARSDRERERDRDRDPSGYDYSLGRDARARGDRDREADRDSDSGSTLGVACISVSSQSYQVQDLSPCLAGVSVLTSTDQGETIPMTRPQGADADTATFLRLGLSQTDALLLMRVMVTADTVRLVSERHIPLAVTPTHLFSHAQAIGACTGGAVSACASGSGSGYGLVVPDALGGGACIGLVRVRPEASDQGVMTVLTRSEMAVCDAPTVLGVGARGTGTTVLCRTRDGEGITLS